MAEISPKWAKTSNPARKCPKSRQKPIVEKNYYICFTLIKTKSLKPMKKVLLTLVAVLGLGIAAQAASYTIDEQSIDAMIEMAEEVTPAALEAEGATDVTIHIGNGAQPVIAFLLALVPVTGWLAIHRMYMGTSILAVILNIVTGAGFGVVYVIDWVMLLIGVLDDNIGQYCNNGRWLMWADLI